MAETGDGDASQGFVTDYDERGHRLAVEYTSDPDIDIGELPRTVEAIWLEYVGRNQRDTRTLPEAIQRVHFGACWLGEQDDYEDACGHAHFAPPGICLDRVLAPPFAEKTKRVLGPDVLTDTIRHEMAHCIFGITHPDERWPEALRLLGVERDAQRCQERHDAWEGGRVPTWCPEGHPWPDMDHAPDEQPLAYFCWICDDHYDIQRRSKRDIESAMEERKHEVAWVRIDILSQCNWWSEILPHPAARVVSLQGNGRILTIRYAWTTYGWHAACPRPSDDGRLSSDARWDPLPLMKHGADPNAAIMNLVSGMDDAQELLASLQEVELHQSVQFDT